jgi:hypothetical protein
MKHILLPIAAIIIAFTAASCSKDYISPEELFNDGSKVAKTVIHTKGSDFDDTVTEFRQIAVYRESDMEGMSHFIAFSGGRMVYDAFMLSIYFNGLDNMKVGDKLNPNRCVFSFVLSSDSNATTYQYDGKITLADIGDDYIILHFQKVRFNCSFGDYMTNGYLYCPLFDEFKE